MDVTRLLIEKGADVNADNWQERTALHDAALCGDVDFAKVLLQNGVDIDAVDEENRTALCIAAGIGFNKKHLGIGVDKGHIRCILQPLCFGAKINEIAINLDESGVLVLIDYKLIPIFLDCQSNRQHV